MENHLNYRIIGKIDTETLKKAMQMTDRSVKYATPQEASVNRIFKTISAAIAIMAVNKIAKRIMS